MLDEAPSDSLSRLVSDPESIGPVMEFITKNDLFENFCFRLAQDEDFFMTLFGPSNETLTIDSRSLLTADDSSVRRLLKIAQACISKEGRLHFQYRERYLLETLGCYLCTPAVETTSREYSESIHVAS
jgi:hypothetical protein